MKLLNERTIRANIFHKELNELLKFHLFDSIDSTNSYLKNNLTKDYVDICCAETQTQGRGRLNRTWYSPAAENIYFSSQWGMDFDIKTLSSLSLVVGLAIVKTLMELDFSEDISIKWPNDIFWKDKKIAGVLIELTTASTGKLAVIIGIGLNVNSSYKSAVTQAQISKPWCSLFDIGNDYLDRNIIIGKLINHLYDHILKFQQVGFNAFQSNWQELDYLFGKSISVMQANNKLCGKASGVNNTGQLILINECSQHILLNSGEVFLMPIQISK